MATVLVIDDERGVREGLCRAVTSAGHHAIPAAGVTEARAAIAQTLSGDAHARPRVRRGALRHAQEY